MTMTDFNDHQRLKFLVPFIYVASWLSMMLGPSYFPVLHNQYCMVITMYLAMRAVVLCGLNAKLVMNYHNTMKGADNDEEKQLLMVQRSYMEVYHAFIIPSYNEDTELLAETLFMLSQHKQAA